MLFFGTTTFESPEVERLIYCRNCRNGQNATIRRVRLWLTAFDVRVLPLWLVRRYLVCRKCNEQYDLEVLQLNPSKSSPPFDRQMLRTMIYAALADGLVDAVERSTIEQLYDQRFEMALLEDQLEQEISAAQREATSLNTYLANYAELMTPEQKRTAVELAYRVMAAAGPPKPGHQRQLHNLCVTLQMPLEEFDVLMAELQRTQPASGRR